MYRLTIEAFVLDDETRAALETAMDDLALFRSSIQIRGGGIEGAIAHYSGESTPELVLVQTVGGREEILSHLERFSDVVGPGTQVVVTGDVDSIDFYRSLMDLGIGSYLVNPITPGAFLKAIGEIFGADKASERGRLIAVTGARGGVGASTIAHNVASALVRLYGKPTNLVDLDLHFGTAAMNFNQEPKFGLKDALSQFDRLDETLMERLLTKLDDNFWLLASNPTLADVDLLTSDGLEVILDMVARMGTYVVLDVPHAWTGPIGDSLLVADEVVVVTDPDLVGLRNAQLLYDTVGPARPAGAGLRCVINHVGLNKSTELGAKDFTETIGESPVASFAWDPAAYRTASCNGQMVVDLKGKARLKSQFDDLAVLLAGRRNNTERGRAAGEKGGLMASLFSKKNRG